MPQLKYYDPKTEEWSMIGAEGNNVYFSYGEYAGRTLNQVIKELKSIIAGGSITQNTLEYHILPIEEDGQRKVLLPVKIDPQNDAFLLFLNPGILSSDSYSLSSEGDSILFNGDLYAGDVLYLVIFKTVRTTPPDTYDGIIISEGSIQESKLAPTIQKKLNDIQEKPSSNSTSIIVSSTEPVDPNENDIWIVI